MAMYIDMKALKAIFWVIAVIIVIAELHLMNYSLLKLNQNMQNLIEIESHDASNDSNLTSKKPLNI